MSAGIAVVCGVVFAAGFAVATLSRSDTDGKREPRPRLCQRCDPASASERQYCVACRPELFFSYTPER